MKYRLFRRLRRQRNNYVRDLSDVYLGERDKLFGSSPPNIQFTFCLAPHADAEDADILGAALLGADVYFPELSGWSPYMEEMFKFVSMGSMKPYDVVAKNPYDRDEYTTERFVKTANCGAFVRFVDLPQGHSLSGEKVTALNAYRSREAYIIREIPRAIKSVLDANPSLTELARPIRVVLSYGSLHTALSLALKQSGEDLRRIFSEKPYIYPRGATYFRRDLFYKSYKAIEMIDS